MRVLVVDDDRLVASSLKTILEADGDIEVVSTLSSGAEAVARFGALRRLLAVSERRVPGGAHDGSPDSVVTMPERPP